MPDAPDTDTTALFRHSWSLYDFITERNYMYHRELYAEVARLLRERAGAGPYRMLDLGCGNARYLAPCLKAAPPQAYTGVDLSAAALAEAAGWLAPLPNVKLVERDLLEAVDSPDTSACELIFTGFAVHHLDTAAKARFFAAAAARLTPGGWLLMIDVVRDAGQSRADYLASYIGFMRANWHDLPPSQFAEAQAHIEAHDFPEDAGALDAMAREAGFGPAQSVVRLGHHQALLFPMPP